MGRPCKCRPAVIINSIDMSVHVLATLLRKWTEARSEWCAATAKSATKARAALSANRGPRLSTLASLAS